MKICERCDKAHDGTFGSGRYCSKSCANTRKMTDDIKKKISESLKISEKFKESVKSATIKKIKTYECVSCGGEYKGYNRSEKCPDCRRKVIHVHYNATSITELSKRTITKLLKRADKGCVLCGWSVASRDIHHIVERSNGGSDDHDNLVVVCPNCHRSIHCLGEEFVSNGELGEKSILYTFSDWKDYYYPVPL